MRGVNIKVGLVVLGTVGFYTMIANSIPQVESEVPTELSFSGNVTPEQLVAAGEELYLGAGQCTSCHGLGTRAPNLVADEKGTGLIGERCGARVSGQDCKTYLHESLVKPTAYVVDGYEPIMPDISRTMSANQIWALVAYLQSVGGTVTVSAGDLPREADAVAANATKSALATESTDAREILQANNCFACHKLGDQGGAIGPPFDGIGSRLNAEAIRRAILLPNADTAAGYAQLAGTMPTNFGTTMNAGQLEAVVAFLGARK